jgi:hypothetical protein
MTQERVADTWERGSPLCRHLMSILNTDQFPRNLARFEEFKRACQRGFVIPFVGAGVTKSAGLRSGRNTC